jgi:cytochrome P450
MSFKPFMGILGTGLVTAHGAHWQQQRVKVGPVLRNDMLEGVADIAHAATERCFPRLYNTNPLFPSLSLHTPW